MDTRRVDGYVKDLKSHQRFLEKKLAEKDEASSHYLKRELLALTWVIAYAEDTVLEAADHQYKWFNERVKQWEK